VQVTNLQLPPIQFPEVNSFSELFVKSHKDFDVNKPVFPELLIDIHGVKEKVSSYCGLSGFSKTAISVYPTDIVIENIKNNSVCVAGPYFFEIINHGKTCLVLWKYNSIIGSRWLAHINFKSLPGFLKVKK
jgi:hypothetical protein